jgi:hypothetical protein
MALRRHISVLFAMGVLSSAGCEPAEPTSDGGTGDTPIIRCTSDAMCDDGAYCNGTERCADGVCAAGAIVTCDDGIECTVDRCAEERRACVAAAPDEDGDGFGAVGCGDGDDCDDTDPTRFPGNVERCDDVDDDCDPSTLGGFDFDADGFASNTCCNPDASGGMLCGTDCDDNRATTFPGALEVCDTLDQDCDGTADDGVDLAVYADEDLDGVGAGPELRACAGVAGISTRSDDCDDANPNRYPGAPELCDALENDCDENIDESPSFVNWYPDTDGDTFGDTDVSLAVRSCVPVTGHSTRGTDCNDGSGAIHPGALELCDGVDNDCNGLLDFAVGLNDWEDDDRDGIVDARCPGGGADCDDNNPLVGGGVPELCDGADNDCDDTVDEGVLSTPYYRDVDADGYGSVASGAVNACVQPAGFSVRGGDCADMVESRNPGAVERCNGADDDCDAAVDESCSSDCADPTEVRCGGTCISPITDERFCGASLSCTGSSAGARCDTDELCSGGACRSQFLLPNGEGVSWAPPAETVFYRIVVPTEPYRSSMGSVAYTLDGTRPGVSPTTEYREVYSGATTVELGDGDTVRWTIEVYGASSYSYPEQRYTHHRDPSASARPGLIPQALTLRVFSEVLLGAAGIVEPGATIDGTAPAFAWRGAGASTPLQYVLSVDGVGTVACEPYTGGGYPGSNVGEMPFSFTAPTTYGVYPVRAGLTTRAGGCAPLATHPAGEGVMIGWLVVAPPRPIKG